MSLASYVCVIHDEKKETMYAGAVYLAVAVIGGMVTLMGLLMLYHAAGTLQLDALLSVCEEIFPENARWLYIAGGCILFGFGAVKGIGESVISKIIENQPYSSFDDYLSKFTT